MRERLEFSGQAFGDSLFDNRSKHLWKTILCEVCFKHHVFNSVNP